jgi:TonB family protein
MRHATAILIAATLAAAATQAVAFQEPAPPPAVAPSPATAVSPAAAPSEVKVAGRDVPAPKRTHFVSPVFPLEAQAAGQRGIVILELVIDAAGKVTTADVLRSVPPFDEAALTAVRQWEYEVTKVDGKAVPVRLTVPITFALKLPEMTREAGIPELRQGALPFFPPGAKGPAKVVAEVASCPTARWRKPPSVRRLALRGGDAADAADVAVRIRGGGASGRVPGAGGVLVRPTSEDRAEAVRPAHRGAAPFRRADPGADASGRGASGRGASAHGATARRRGDAGSGRGDAGSPSHSQRARGGARDTGATAGRCDRRASTDRTHRARGAGPRAGRCPTLARRADAAAGRGDPRRSAPERHLHRGARAVPTPAPPRARGRRCETSRRAGRADLTKAGARSRRPWPACRRSAAVQIQFSVDARACRSRT